MKFKNVSNKVKKFKLNGEWVNVQPNEEIELPMRINENEQGISLIESNGNNKQEKKELKQDKTKPKEILIEPKKIKLKNEKELNKMKKDELNDYGALIGLKEINSYMLKNQMIKKIVEYIKSKWN